MSLGILLTWFSSSEIRNGSLSVKVKFSHVVGGVVPDALLRACCQRCPRLLDWVLYWRSRDAVHPVRPQLL